MRNEKARKYLSSIRKKEPVPFSQKFPKADPLALKLLERLLAFDPKDRPTAEEVWRCCSFYLCVFSACRLTTRCYLMCECWSLHTCNAIIRHWLIRTLRVSEKLRESLLANQFQRWNLNLSAREWQKRTSRNSSFMKFWNTILNCSRST